MVSGDSYANKGLGGYAEYFMKDDITILAAPGNKGNQCWTDRRIAPLVNTQEAGKPLRLYRKNADCTYSYCGLNHIVDRWKNKESFSEPGCSIVGDREICFVKLKWLLGQQPLIPVELTPKSLRRSKQLVETILNL